MSLTSSTSHLWIWHRNCATRKRLILSWFLCTIFIVLLKLMTFFTKINTTIQSDIYLLISYLTIIKFLFIFLSHDLVRVSTRFRQTDKTAVQFTWTTVSYRFIFVLPWLSSPLIDSNMRFQSILVWCISMEQNIILLKKRNCFYLEFMPFLKISIEYGLVDNVDYCLSSSKAILLFHLKKWLPKPWTNFSKKLDEPCMLQVSTKLLSIFNICAIWILSLWII
jgi:hypothetical protein